MRGVSDTVDRLERSSLLCLSPEIRRLFLESGEIRSCATGEKLCIEGEPLSEVVIPLSGMLKLLRHREDGHGDEVIGYLLKNRSLCLGPLIEGARAPYTAVAEESLRALCVKTSDFLNVLRP